MWLKTAMDVGGIPEAANIGDIIMKGARAGLIC